MFKRVFVGNSLDEIIENIGTELQYHHLMSEARTDLFCAMEPLFTETCEGLIDQLTKSINDGEDKIDSFVARAWAYYGHLSRDHRVLYFHAVRMPHALDDPTQLAMIAKTMAELDFCELVMSHYMGTLAYRNLSKNSKERSKARDEIYLYDETQYFDIIRKYMAKMHEGMVVYRMRREEALMLEAADATKQ